MTKIKKCLKNYRNLEARSLEENDGLIFVIDSSDRARISESRVELLRILNLRTSISSKPVSAPILILANKQDQTEALTVKELSELLNLKNVLSCPWHIQPTCALTGAGVTEGFTWLASALKESSNNNQLCWNYSFHIFTELAFIELVCAQNLQNIDFNMISTVY